ncbi:ATP synthase F1 subunit delta [Larkinella terrae]|uniref:ATP synthase subunit delta n=1 Tax=Larkinella terrae TaxID=2025311 RepID=A0A7K0EUW2_9BACT|nr:ATP synthase F1 subunit delta [Larkinella terrae]MRS65552.1 ATP synthase F1 subunit delta [Larkinella terrae]
MAESTVAFRYAKSLIDLAKEKDKVEEVYKDMMFFRDVVRKNRDLMLALKSPILRHEKKLNVLRAVFENRVDPLSFSIFNIISKKNREGIMDSVANEYVRQYNDLKGIQKVQVVTTQPLTEELRKQFTRVVADSTGKQIELEEIIDPKLIGGYILRIGDRQVDASIRNKLAELRLSFLN